MVVMTIPTPCVQATTRQRGAPQVPGSREPAIGTQRRARCAPIVSSAHFLRNWGEIGVDEEVTRRMGHGGEMPEAISSRQGALPAGCDPSVTSCMETPDGVESTIVTIPPVYVAGSAEKDLVKRYDQEVSGACRGQRDAAIAGCTQVLGSLADLSIGSAFTNSLACAQLVSAFDDCKQAQAAKLDVIERCEDEGGVALAGTRSNEVICDKR